jgi:aldose 1-epimerase
VAGNCSEGAKVDTDAMDNNFSSWMDRIRGGYHNSPLMRSGLVTVMSIVVLLGLIFGAWYEHIQGNFHKARTIEVVPDKVTTARPGGMDLVRLNRVPRAATMSPEFVSATMAPGLGMEILQATINLPAREDMPILLNTGNGAQGEITDKTVGAPIVVNVSERIVGHWSTPVNIMSGQADHMSYNTMPDGGGSDASFGTSKTSTNGPDVDARVSITLSGHSLDLLVVAKNNAAEPRAVTLSWQPQFLLPTVGTTMLIPPRLENAGNSTTPAAIMLGARDVKATYNHLKRSYLTNGPEIQLNNDAEGYELHLIALSPSIRRLRVDVPKGSKAALLAFSTEGDSADDPETVLKPGESIQLRLRVEVSGTSTDSR